MYVRHLSRRSAVLGLGAMTLVAARLPALAQSDAETASITSVTPRTAVSGKLATRTEILAGSGEPAMVSLGAVSALRGAIAMYEDIVAEGGWPSVPRDILGKSAEGPAVAVLRRRLMAEGYLPADAPAAADPERFDRPLSNAVRGFQNNHGIAPTGWIDARTRIELNITAEARLFTLHQNVARVAAHLDGLGARAILVNIPSAQLEAVEFGEVYSRHNVVVGKLSRPTPSLKSRVSDVLFNPYWNVPASIVGRDLIPKILKDPTIFDQMRLRVFDGVGGPEIDPYTVDWAGTPPERYHFRQEPGSGNAMARVKINFANPFMVYMHDTPHRELFASNARYESSGCVRVEQVQTLVQWILSGQQEFGPADFEMIAASEEPYEIAVKHPPDVRFMYLTAWATEDGRINFRPDIYSLDGTGFVLGQPEPAGM